MLINGKSRKDAMPCVQLLTGTQIKKNMKKTDLYIALLLLAIFTPFIVFESAYKSYSDFYARFPFVSSFIKFAILATIGEVIGLRIRTGKYSQKGFGVLPRAFVWGFLGMSVQAAFLIFAYGSPKLLEFIGFEQASELMADQFSWAKILVAFSISFFLNIFYAPVLMTVHKITDTHIERTGGSIRGLFSKMDIASILKEVDWNMHYGFVLKRTIFLFWIPAQTINFMMPEELRVLIAAIYGIVLGVILAFAARNKTVVDHL